MENGSRLMSSLREGMGRAVCVPQDPARDRFRGGGGPERRGGTRPLDVRVLYGFVARSAVTRYRGTSANSLAVLYRVTRCCPVWRAQVLSIPPRFRHSQ